MQADRDLESLIRSHVILGKKSPGGYEAVKCAVCSDYKSRGGFKFNADGSVIYSCFNCGCKAVGRSGQAPSKSFKSVLTSFGIATELVDDIGNFKVDPHKPQPEPRVVGLPIKDVPLPEPFMSVTSDSPWAEVARYYLTSRGLDPLGFEYFVSEHPKYVGRLLIPYRFRDKIVYWQGRAMDEAIQPRYKNPTVEKENIFFNMDELYRYTSDPLYVTEGPLDALSIGPTAIALTGSSLTGFKWGELVKAAVRRRVVFIIDKNLPGYKLGSKVLTDGRDTEMYVTVFPQNIDDANDALRKLGKLWTVNHVATTAVRGFQGKSLLELNCK